MTAQPQAAPHIAPAEWRPIPEWEGLYEASSYGRIRSIARVVTSKTGTTRAFPSVLRAVQVDPTGRVLATLCRDGEQISLSLPVLIARTFLGPRPEGHQVAHNDGNPLNNAVYNLRYATPAENEADKRLHGTHPQLNKTHCPQGHPYVGDNIKRDPNGSRKCRTCANERGREYAASGRRRAVRPSAMSPARRWAIEQGIPIATTGRLPKHVIEAYRLAT